MTGVARTLPLIGPRAGLAEAFTQPSELTTFAVVYCQRRHDEHHSRPSEDRTRAHHSATALTIATIPARIASGSSGHSLTTSASSGESCSLLRQWVHQHDSPSSVSLCFSDGCGLSASFFTAAEGWGNFSQERRGQTQRNELHVRYGRLPLSQSSLGLPAKATSAKATVKLAGKTILTKANVVGGAVTIALPDVTPQKGQTLTVETTWQ